MPVLRTCSARANQTQCRHRCSTSMIDRKDRNDETQRTNCQSPLLPWHDGFGESSVTTEMNLTMRSWTWKKMTNTPHTSHRIPTRRKRTTELMCKPLRPNCGMGPLESSLCLRRSHRRWGVPEHGPVGLCALAFAPLGACFVPLGTQVLLDCARNFFFCFTSKTTKGNSQTGVSFPCPFRTTRSLRARA